MWASIAMNVRATDSCSESSSIDSGSSYSTSSSYSSYSSYDSSGSSDSDSTGSWASFSSSSTTATNPFVDPLSLFPIPKHLPRKSLLIDYSKMPNSSCRSLKSMASSHNHQDRRQSFQVTPQNDSDRSITLHGRHPYSPRRTADSTPGKSLLTTSSSHCLSRFLQKESRHGSKSLPGILSSSRSSAAVMPNLVRHTSKSSRPGLRSTTFSRRRTLERKLRVRTLNQALRWDAVIPQVTAPFKSLRLGDDGDYETASEASSIVTSSSNIEVKKDPPVTFSYKKSAGFPSTTMPPGLSRNISNTSSTLHGILKESRRETLLDLLEDPKLLSSLNTSSLVPNFRSVSIVSKEGEESPVQASTIDAPVSFHDGIRDLSSQEDTTASYKSMTVLVPSTSIGSIPSTTTVVEPAFYHRLPAPVPKRPAYGAKSRSMKDVRRAMQDLAGSNTAKPVVGGNNFRMMQHQQRQRRQDMKRSASAPKNSFVQQASSSAISRSSRAARSSALSRESSEIAALQALAGKKHPILRRASLATNDSGAGTAGTTSGGGGIPTTITIVRRTSSSEDSCPMQPKRSLETPPLPDDDTSTTEDDTFAASPETPSPSERERTIRHRMSSLVKRTSSRRRESFMMDASSGDISISTNNNRRGSDTSDSASKRRHFQRASSSRKSFSLMIQHANLQQQQKQQGGSSRDIRMGDASMQSSSTRQRRRSSICSNSTNGGLDESTANLSTSGRRNRTAVSSSSKGPVAPSTRAVPAMVERRTTTDSEKVAPGTPNRRTFLKRQASVVSRRRILALRNTS